MKLKVDLPKKNKKQKENVVLKIIFYTFKEFVT